MSESTAPPGSGQGPAGGGDGPRVTYEYAYREGHGTAAPGSHSGMPASPGGAGASSSSSQDSLFLTLAVLMFLAPLVIVGLDYKGVIDLPASEGRKQPMGAVFLVFAAGSAAMLRRSGREVAVKWVVGVMVVMSLGAVFGLRAYDEAQAKAAVEDCRAGGTQPFNTSGPQLAAMQLTPAQQASWNATMSSIQPPEDSPLQPEDLVMSPVVYGGGSPAIVVGIPGAGEERYFEEAEQALRDLPGSVEPIETEVAGRKALVGSFMGGSALATTNGCWGVLVMGPDAASVQAMTPALVGAATVPGRPVSAPSS